MTTPIDHTPDCSATLINSCTLSMIFQVLACPTPFSWIVSHDHDNPPRRVFVEHPHPDIHPGEWIHADWTLDQYLSIPGTLWSESLLRHITPWTLPTLALEAPHD